jgi:hypothetical protein
MAALHLGSGCMMIFCVELSLISNVRGLPLLLEKYWSNHIRTYHISTANVVANLILVKCRLTFGALFDVAMLVLIQL